MAVGWRGRLGDSALAPSLVFADWSAISPHSLNKLLTSSHAVVPLSLSANLLFCKDYIHISSIIILSANTAIFKVLLCRLLWATAKLITALTQS